MYLLLLGAIVLLAVHLVFFLRFLKKTPSTRGKKSRQVRAPVATVIANKNDAPYEIRDLHSPLLKGMLLQLATKLAFTPLGKWLIIDDVLKKSNADLMGGEYIPEDPQFDTIPSPKDDYTKCDNKKVIEKAVTSQKTADGFRYNTILDYYHAYQDKRCTPSDVAGAVLQAMTESNKTTPPLFAVIEWDNSVVMAMAEASTDRWQRGAPLSYLDGVPVAIKGELALEPYSLMGGAKFKAAVCENIAEGDLVMRLREAGAILIGVTNMQEFGTGTLGSNPNAGIPRNPHNPAHYCGGSSSGSGASVAVGFCPLALGADGGGSVRIPSSLCGITGLKPTSKLLDSNGAIHIAYGVGVIGPLASSSLDIAIAMDVFLNGTNKPFSLQGLGNRSLHGMKVGIYSQFFRHADKGVVSSCQKSVGVLEQLGAEVKEIVIPELEESRVAHFCLISSEMLNNLAIDVERHFDEFNPETLLLLRAAHDFPAKEYINSLKQRARIIKIMEDIFKDVDLIVTPSSAIPAPKIRPGAASHGVLDGTTSGQLMRFMFLANIAGLPAISVPVGVSEEGLPIGLQIMAPWHEDGLLIKVGHALESEMKQVLHKPPQVYHDLLR